MLPKFQRFYYHISYQAEIVGLVEWCTGFLKTFLLWLLRVEACPTKGSKCSEPINGFLSPIMNKYEFRDQQKHESGSVLILITHPSGLLPVSKGLNTVGLKVLVSKNSISPKISTVFTKLHAKTATSFLMTLNQCGGTIYTSTLILASVSNLSYFKAYLKLFLLISFIISTLHSVLG